MANPTRAWTRWLPPTQMLGLADTFEDLLKTKDRAPQLRAGLVGHTTITANTFQQFRKDMASVREADVLNMTIAIGESKAATIWLDSYAPKIYGAEGHTDLRVSGEDEALAHGVFALLVQRIDRVFEDLDNPETTSSAVPSTLTIGDISIHGGSLAVSGSGDATATTTGSTGHTGSGQRASHWWNNPWLITLLGGTAAAVVAGVLLAILLH